MAGVGFRLNKMFHKGGVSTDLLAIAYSVVVSSGPWIITTISLWIILNFFKITNLYFNIAIVYSFVFSIIISGLFIMFESRRISDLIYMKQYKKIIPEVMGMLVYAILFTILFLLVFFLFNKHELWFVLSFAYLFISLLTLWIISIASVSTDAVNWYIMAYLIMGFFSIILSNYFGSENNPLGYILGYAFGVNIGTFVHYMITLIYFGTEMNITFEWMKEIKKYWQNIFIGFTYYLALWIDDFITWHSKNFGEIPLKGFHFSFIYDSPMFLAYLTIIPTATMFILVLETRFYKTYKLFYDSLIEGYNYSEILIRQKNMEKELKFDINLTVRVQIIITLILFFLNEMNLLPFVSEMFKPVLRLGLIGAMMNSFYLMIMLLLLYFDFRNIALYLNIGVFLINFLLSIIFINKFGYYTLGASYSFAFAIGTFIGYKILIKNVQNLIKIEYYRQKLAVEEGFYIKYSDIKKIMGEER
ncbi:exopolysaccharide Pel transporter PelG [Marinitoga aeolica]|uniref:Exopolysaccharide Pel transporter PelG n=1 Tax=Marinitoga aeolica TaxID=2809031 RepID=A0ABY8PNM3_9BACT|nr:exopolysaccharide Pel transporter PelG [Marinitoga aeolica]WGS64179.1 exopolysaccharide Pel transporter PelG [Marinitoga aeolica]